MKRLFVLLASALLAACSASNGAEVASQPNGRVRDLAGILDAATEARLTQRLGEAARLYGPQVGIVTVKSLDGIPIKKFATDYANTWGLGDNARNDGLIIVIAPNDRQTRIGTGRRIETAYPDAWAQQVIDKTLLPQFRQNNYGRGLEGAVDMIIARMREHPTLPANNNTPNTVTKAA